MMSTIASDYAVWLVLLSYLVGAIPFGLVVTKLAGEGDIRNIGSGNIGATNVLRTGKPFLAIATLLLDGGKGALMGLLVWGITGDASLGYVAGFFAFIGHLYPVYLNFEGGKGVATGLGIFLALAPMVGLAVIATWLIVAFFSRYSSLSALTTFILAPLYLVIQNIFIPESIDRSFIMLAIVMAYATWGRHNENIERLRAGNENKINLSMDN